MNRERVLITGCGGMLGHAIYPYFGRRFPVVVATDKDVNEPWIQPLDVRDVSSVERVFREVRPDLVLHLAAETSLEYCEDHPDVAADTNAHATGVVARLAYGLGARLVYISTAGVFDGTKEGMYTEADEPNPIMVYGRTKLDGEARVRALCPQSYIIRAGWMVGGGRHKDKKFVSKILEQIASGRTVINAVTDRWGTPTYTHDFAMNLLQLLAYSQNGYGTYHMVCEGHGTRYDIAREIVQICRRSDIEVRPVDSSFFAEEYFAPRPRSEMLLNAHLAEIGLNRMRGWRDALRAYIAEDYPEIAGITASLHALPSRSTNQCLLQVVK